MSASALLTLVPLAILTATLVIVLLLGALRPTHHRMAWISIGGLAAATLSLAPLGLRLPLAAGQLLLFDGRTLLFAAVILVSGLGIGLMSIAYLSRREVHGERHHREYYLLLLLALAGALLLVESHQFAILFVGLETLSVALFGLTAYPVGEIRSLEAAIKYLILSGTSSALLLLGVAFFYAATGSLAFSAPAAVGMATFARAGVLLVTVAFAFKLALVPFHMWTPDVYEGAPAPVGALLAAVSKGAAAVAWWRILVESGATQDSSIAFVLIAVAVLSMLVGNLLGLFQENVKRMLAYSSIGHMGFWLVPVAVAGPITAEAAGYYLATYVASVLTAFGAIAFLSMANPEEEMASVKDFRGLFWRRPVPALALAAAFLSLAGIPLTVGFIGKFYVFAASLAAANWALVLVVAISSAIGIYFYLRVVTALFIPTHEAIPAIAGHGTVVMLLLTFFIVFYGMVPAPLMDAIRKAVGSP